MDGLDLGRDKDLDLVIGRYGATAASKLGDLWNLRSSEELLVRAEEYMFAKRRCRAVRTLIGVYDMMLML